jgi:hypothetical protein
MPDRLLPGGFVAVALAGAVLAAVGTGCVLCRRQVVAAGGLYMRYFFSAELCYHEVKVEGTKLTYTYYVAPDTLRCWMIQVPCYADSDLKTVTMKLPRNDARELAHVVNRSGFLKLPDTCGDTGTRQRCYAYVVTAADYCGSVEKTVVYRSSPEAGAPPESFIQVAASLAQAVKRNFGHDVALPR